MEINKHSDSIFKWIQTIITRMCKVAKTFKSEIIATLSQQLKNESARKTMMITLIQE
jgi:hypothetical protein